MHFSQNIKCVVTTNFLFEFQHSFAKILFPQIFTDKPCKFIVELVYAFSLRVLSEVLGQKVCPVARE